MTRRGAPLVRRTGVMDATLVHRWRGLWLALLMVMALPACAAQWQLRFDGIGPLRIGMRFDDVNRRTGHLLRRTDPALLPTAGCEQLPLARHPGVWLMFIDDVLRRIDINAAGTSTQKGIAVGDAVARVARAYPAVLQEPNVYDEDEFYLTTWSRDGRHAVRFETYRGKVALMYAGAIEHVRYVEGCL